MLNEVPNIYNFLNPHIFLLKKKKQICQKTQIHFSQKLFRDQNLSSDESINK